VSAIVLLVSLSANFSASDLVPTNKIESPEMAIASAHGCLASPVHIYPVTSLLAFLSTLQEPSSSKAAKKSS